MDIQSAADWIKENILLVCLAVFGVSLVMFGGVLYARTQEQIEVEVIKAESSNDVNIWVDVQGAVEKPGVYELNDEARIKDALAAAGGMTSSADRGWVARYLNLAQKVVDGAKVFIPAEGFVAGISDEDGGANTQAAGSLVNINTASLGQLDGLVGIGETRARAIVDGRPYGAVEELVSRKILPQGVFDKIKDQISIY